MQFIIVSKSNWFVNPFFQNQEKFFIPRKGASKIGSAPLYNKEENDPKKAVCSPSPAVRDRPYVRGCVLYLYFFFRIG